MSRRARLLAAGIALLVAAGCGTSAEVGPQACTQELTTDAFRVCLPGDARLAVSGTSTASATVGDAQVHLLERPAQPGDADQAAYAALAELQHSVGRTLSVARSPDPVTIGEEGPLDVADADGAFQALSVAYDTGEVDDTVAWGRALTVDGVAGAVLLVRQFAGGDEITAPQRDAAQADAMPIVVSLAPR